MANHTTSIKLKDTTIVKLKKVGTMEDTYDILINKLINYYERNRFLYGGKL